MRTERQRRERQLLDIAKARNAKTHEFDRAREEAQKVAAVTARLKPQPVRIPRPQIDWAQIELAQKQWFEKLKFEIMKAKALACHDDQLDALR